LKAAITAFNWNDMDALAELCTEDVVNIPIEGWPDDPVYHGRDGMRRLAGTWWENFSGTHIKAERLIDQGDRVVMLSMHTGTADGVRVEQRLGGLLDFRDGKICHARWILGFKETLEAAGLPPDAGL
jgi:ketosteroid isomerase-like protein